MQNAIIALVLSILTSAAAAQNDNLHLINPPAPQPTMSTIAAPVGHRQPTQSSLPPTVRNNERRGAMYDPLGPIPKICRAC